MNPLTPLTAAICAVAVVMVAHESVVSGIFFIAAAVLALVAGRRHRRALLAALVISVPATVSYALIYVPFAVTVGPPPGTFAALCRDDGLRPGAALLRQCRRPHA
jgi:hypothetical protein